MRKLLKTLPVLALMAIGFAACTDLCRDIDCTNGTCAEGICTCSDGYEKDGGNKCASLQSFYVGTHAINKTCAVGSTATDSITIDSMAGKKILIKGVETGIDIEAEVTSQTSFTIPEQYINGDTIEAFTGTATSSKISFTYKRKNGSLQTSCTISTK
ncbi:MAG: hypothetical protein GY810_18795 [Aureispira sp.]|nr:hypothetical protein [Aureispira sp.]